MAGAVSQERNQKIAGPRSFAFSVPDVSMSIPDQSRIIWPSIAIEITADEIRRFPFHRSLEELAHFLAHVGEPPPREFLAEGDEC